MLEEEKPWRPLSVEALAVLLAKASFPWWVAGGLALELAVGHAYRSHGDIDVLLLRRDHLDARRFLAGWDCWAADPPGTLRPWPVDEQLKDCVHDIWCRRAPDDDWRLQLMLDESEQDRWISRRDATIRAPLTGITRTTANGIPYLAPHVQLYYNAKNPREKDELDFQTVIHNGVQMDTSWLVKAISSSYGPNHPWLERLPG